MSRFRMQGFVVLAIPLVLNLSTGLRQASAESSAPEPTDGKSKLQQQVGDKKTSGRKADRNSAASDNRADIQKSATDDKAEKLAANDKKKSAGSDQESKKLADGGKKKDAALLATIAPHANPSAPQSPAANAEIEEYFSDFTASQKKHKLAHAASTVKIYAPQDVVWKVLIDFERYPEMFKRLDTCKITKKENGLIFAESYLKPQMFVKKLCQHTVTDISQGPTFLRWKMLDGNFKSVVGTWDLTMAPGTSEHPDICVAKYTLWADPGPIIPAPLVSMLLHTVEHEVVSSFKKGCEHQYKKDGVAKNASAAEKTSKD